MTDEEYGALRASAALWAGTSVLITDERGRVLVQRVDYRPSRLLSGGAVDKGESPARAAARELWEELGVTAVVDRGLAVDWVSADAFGAPGVMRFPGEIVHVYDGGVWDGERIAAIRLPGHEVEAVEFVEPADLNGLMIPGDARRALSALRARIDGGGPALLEDGVPIAPGVLDRAGALGSARERDHRPFHPSPVPDGLPVREARAGCSPRTGGCSSSQTLDGRGLPARRDARTGGPRRPLGHAGPRSRRSGCGHGRPAPVPRAPPRPGRTVRARPVRRRPHPSRPSARRSGHRPRPRPGPGHPGAGAGALRLGPARGRTARGRAPGPRAARHPRAARQAVTELTGPAAY